MQSWMEKRTESLGCNRRIHAILEDADKDGIANVPEYYNTTQRKEKLQTIAKTS